jgi:iron(III) transport system permease protein
MIRAAGTGPLQWRPSLFQVVIVVIGLCVAATVLLTLGRLAVWAWDDYGTSIPSFYIHDVFGNPAIRQMLLNTAIAVLLSSALATGIAAVLAWLNERTDASIGMAGSILPLVPFLMPAIALPLGWLFLASPQAGLLNMAIRGGLRRVGWHVTTGPLNVYSWPAMIFLYTVFLCGFAYLVIASSMRTLDRGLEEAAKLAGARPPRILFRIVLPALRPALFSAFLMCLIVAVVMVSVPITIGPASNITILSVDLVNLITTQSPPQYGQAFLLGLLLLVPVLLAWWLQFRTASRGRFAVIGGKAAVGQKLQLGRWRIAGRGVFFGYVLVAVILPLFGLIYVAGLDFWSSVWPPQSWHPLKNVKAAVDDPVIRRAIKTSVTLGLTTGAALIVLAHLVSYGQRLFPRLGRIVDVLTKIPAVVAQILIAIALLVTLGAPPFQISSGWLLFVGYLVVFLPFASVITTGAQHLIGRDIVEAAKIANASDMRTFASIVTPLARPALVAGFLLMYVLISGETNVSLILASTQRPVVGFVMLDLFNFSSYPKVASFALVITLVNLVCIGVFTKLLSGRSRLGIR